jgi:hypothetical protein
MRPHGSIGIVRRWHDLCAKPIRGCFNNLEGLNNRHLPTGCGLRVRELDNGLRLGTVVPSQDLSGAWVTIHR